MLLYNKKRMEFRIHTVLDMSTDKTWDEDDPRQRAWISVRQRIFDYYLRKIRSGELHAGDRLPTTREIAEKFGTVDSNAHQALQELVRSHLVLRRPRIGTVVMPASRRLRDIVFMVSWQTLQRNEEFTRLLTGILIEKLHKRMISCSVIYDTPDHQAAERVRRMVNGGEIDGVILRNVSYEPEFQRIPTPYAAMNQLLNDVTRDLMFRSIADAGCTRIAVIDPQDKDATCGVGRNLQLTRKYGLDLRREWYCTPREMKLEVPLLNYTRFGWMAFDYLNRLKDRPDGIILLSDSLISGLYMAASFNGVKLGRDYAVVSHHTRENKVLIPFDCTLIQHSIDEIATDVIERLCARAAGKEPVKPRELSLWVTRHRVNTHKLPVP